MIHFQFIHPDRFLRILLIFAVYRDLKSYENLRNFISGFILLTVYALMYEIAGVRKNIHDPFRIFIQKFFIHAAIPVIILFVKRSLQTQFPVHDTFQFFPDAGELFCNATVLLGFIGSRFPSFLHTFQSAQKIRTPGFRQFPCHIMHKLCKVAFRHALCFMIHLFQKF